MISELFRNDLCQARHFFGDLTHPPLLLKEGTRAWGVWGAASTPTVIREKIISSKLLRGYQSPQRQAQKRGRLIIYASIEAHEAQFTLSRSDHIYWERLVAQSNDRH